MNARAAKAHVWKRTVAARTANKNIIVKIAMPTARCIPVSPIPPSARPKFCKRITSGRVCAAWNAPLGSRGKRSPSGYARQMSNCRRCPRWTPPKRTMCWSWMNSGRLSGQKKQTLDLDSFVPPHTSDCRLLYWWTQRRSLLALVVVDSACVSALCHL